VLILLCWLTNDSTNLNDHILTNNEVRHVFKVNDIVLRSQ